MYANKTRTAYYDGKVAAAKDAGLVEERRRLNPAEHCADCIGFANLGWQPIGSLPEPGEQSVCRANCKCTKEFRDQDDVDAEQRRQEIDREWQDILNKKERDVLQDILPTGRAPRGQGPEYADRRAIYGRITTARRWLSENRAYISQSKLDSAAALRGRN
jgi:hypothetical protein